MAHPQPPHQIWGDDIITYIWLSSEECTDPQILDTSYTNTLP